MTVSPANPSDRARQRVQISIHRGDRDALLPLFSLADDSSLQIAQYLALGDVLVAEDAGEIVGHLQIAATDEPGVLEIRNMAVLESCRHRGVGTALVGAVVAYGRNHGARRLIVATAAADTGNLRFYQRRGFRLYKIVRDAFGPAKGYPADALSDGIALRDQVWLDLDLAE